jgi:hypothetical protein
MSHASAPALPPRSSPTSVSTRAAFAAWLVRHRADASALTIKEMVSRSKVSISQSAAYRTALALGFRGARFNQTRYATFWLSLNWQLPDGALAEIWGIDRGNLRRRRERLHKGAPKYDLVRDHGDAKLTELIRREERKSRGYQGPRPC